MHHHNWGRHLWLFIGVLVAGMAHPPQASADSVDLTFHNVSPSMNVTFSLAGAHVYNQTTAAGAFNWSGTGGRLKGDFTSFCIELTQNICPGGHYHYTLVDPSAAGNPDKGIFGVGTMGPMGKVRAELLSELFGRHYGDVVKADRKHAAGNAAAFQMAVWEIVYDGNSDRSHHFNLDLGATVPKGYTNNFWAHSSDSKVNTLAQNWLNDLTGTGPEMKLTGLTSPDAQDQITPAMPSPEPSTFVLAVLAAVCQFIRMVGNRICR